MILPDRRKNALQRRAGSGDQAVLFAGLTDLQSPPGSVLGTVDSNQVLPAAVFLAFSGGFRGVADRHRYSGKALRQSFLAAGVDGKVCRHFPDICH